MAKFSAGAFKKELQKKAEKSARSKDSTTPIAEKAKETMRDVIEERVYNRYSPEIYERRGENGGLIDNNNIVATITDNHIILDNIAAPNDSILGTPIRENPEGLLYEWMDKGLIDTSFFLNLYTPKWKDDRIGMTERIINSGKLKYFAAKTIVKNIK